MRISDCSSDVCASDLELKAGPHIAPLADPVAQGGIDGGEGCGSLAYSRRPEVFPDTTGIVGERRCAESSLAPDGTDAPIDLRRVVDGSRQVEVVLGRRGLLRAVQPAHCSAEREPAVADASPVRTKQVDTTAPIDRKGAV